MWAARYLAMVVAKAHARQMDAVTPRNGVTKLGRNRTANLDAPSWLWSSSNWSPVTRPLISNTAVNM
jgi:hypothetical protein